MRILETPRLRLRWFRESDADFLLHLLNEPEWIAGIRDSGVRSHEAAIDWIQSQLVPPYWRQGHGFWLVERRSDREPLGLCGLLQRDTLPLPDLGYGFARRHWGHGYAREAARACLAYAVQFLGRSTLLAITAPVNPGSCALLSDLGFVETGLQLGPGGPTRHWQWQAPAGALPKDAATQAALMRRFWSLFRLWTDQPCALAALPALCLPDARFEPPRDRRSSGLPAASIGVCEFLSTRVDLLESGRLSDCRVRASAGKADHQTLEWSGCLDGRRQHGVSDVRVRFATDHEQRWRIASLHWR